MCDKWLFQLVHPRHRFVVLFPSTSYLNYFHIKKKFSSGLLINWEREEILSNYPSCYLCACATLPRSFSPLRRERALGCVGVSVCPYPSSVSNHLSRHSPFLLLKISTVFFHFVEKAICHPKRILFIIQFIVDLLHRFSLLGRIWTLVNSPRGFECVCVECVGVLLVCVCVCVVLCDVSVNEKKKEGKSLERCHDRLNGIALFSKKRLFGIRKLNNKWLPLLQLTRRWRPHPASSSCPTCPVYYFITGYWSAAASLNRHEVLVQPSFTVILYICRIGKNLSASWSKS